MSVTDLWTRTCPYLSSLFSNLPFSISLPLPSKTFQAERQAAMQICWGETMTWWTSPHFEPPQRWFALTIDDARYQAAVVATHIQLVRSNIIGSSHFYPRQYWTKLLKKIKRYLHKWTSKKGLKHKQVGGPTARSGGNRHQRSRYLQIKHDLLEINRVFLIEDGLCTHSIFHQAQRKKIPSSQQWSRGRILFHKTKNFRSFFLRKSSEIHFKTHRVKPPK